MSTWLFVDVSSIAWAEFHGAARGDPTAALVGTVGRFLRLSERFAPANLLLCFDVGPYNRQKLFSDYKVRRGKEVFDPAQDAKDQLRQLLADLWRRPSQPDLPPMVAATGYEADDHIAAAVQGIPGAESAVIVSRDRDLLQLLRPNVLMYDHCTHAQISREDFRTAWYDLHPFQWAEVKAIAGCDTDDVPGVPGIADKTAAKYLAGLINPKTETHRRCREFTESSDYYRNLTLTRLPFALTPSVTLRTHPPLTADTCAQVCAKLGIELPAETFLSDFGRRYASRRA